MGESGCDFGMIGIGTMGEALLFNMADHGFSVAAVDINPEKVANLNASTGGRAVKAFNDPAEFVKAMRKPRAMMMLVPAGDPVDSVISTYRPLLEPGDFLIDGGNSFYKDTDRRERELRGAGFGFIGMGVSGGESGARHGPSMMPGGTPENYARVKPVLEAVAAKFQGEPCVALVGSGSAGHYVKTVHNGIEYAIMQLIAESYDFMKRGLCMEVDEIADEFDKMNQGALNGFLIEIASVVLRKRDPDNPEVHLVDEISDKAKQKGTGKWTSQDAMDLGIPIPTIDAAVGARELSSLKDERLKAEQILQGSSVEIKFDKDEMLEVLEHALRAAILLSYVQGFALLRQASLEYGFGTDLQTVAKIWRNGCIIRSKSLEDIRAAFERTPDQPNLLLDPEFAAPLIDDLGFLRQLVSGGIRGRIPFPAFGASIGYLDGYGSGRLPANLIQGQRDLFGAHTYERLDKPGTFHTQWVAE